MSPFRAGSVPEGLHPELLTAQAFTGTYTLLADISEFEPSITDATYLAWSKAVVIRAAYGDAHDDRAWYGGQRRDLLHSGGARFLGIYQYLVAGQDGGAQASALHDLAGPLRPGEVMIADFEEGQRGTLSAWYNRMLALGYPGKYLWTYTGLNFGQSQGVLPVEWIAAYGQGEPTVTHRLWQFSSSYNVPGVGLADCSVFHGSIDELAALGYSAAPVTVPPTPAPTGLGTVLRSMGTAATLSWSPVPGQAGYHFQLEWWKPGFGWVLSVDTQVRDTSALASLPSGSKYRWRVAAGTADYIWTNWTEFDTP